MTFSDDRLWQAARSGSAKVIDFYLSHTNGALLSKDFEGRSALMLAAHEGHASCVSLLLPRSDVLSKDHSGYTALMWAVMRGNENCVRLLLPHSDPGARNNNDETALMLSAFLGHSTCVRLLLSQSDLLARNNDGLSASQMAAVNGYSCIAELINVHIAQNEAAIIDRQLPHKLTPSSSRTTPTQRL